MTTTIDVPLRELLATYRGARVHAPSLVDDQGRLVGNNGDRLMVLGTQRVFDDLALTCVEDPAAADLLILRANGGMLERATFIPAIFRRLSQGWPDRPMLVLPSTFHYPSRPFAREVGPRRAPLTIYCREPASYEHLRSHDLPGCVRLGLDHDLAFELEATPLVDDLRRVPATSVLMIERTDIEHVSVAFRSERLRWRRRVGALLPPLLKRALYPAVTLVRGRRRTPFRTRCESLLERDHPQLLGATRDVRDISNVNTCTFDEFCQAIGRAAVVFTTRLHAGLLSAMLGRPTYLFEGPYHKIRGIHEQSLRARAHVQLVAGA